MSHLPQENKFTKIRINRDQHSIFVCGPLKYGCVARVHADFLGVQYIESILTQPH